MSEKIKFSQMKVEEVMDLVVKDPTVISLNDDIKTLLKKLIEDPRKRHVYVVDDNNCLIGVVRMNYIVQYLFPFEVMMHITDECLVRNFFNFGESSVGDIMNVSPRFVMKNTKLSDVARIFIEEKINELPVVDENKKLIGQINVFEIIIAYLESLK